MNHETDTMQEAEGVRREFLGWDRPALETGVEVLARWADARSGGGEVLDLSDFVVVLPGARAGRLLLERLVARAEAEERVLRPPSIRSPGGLPELLYVPELPAPDPVLERLVWIDALRRTPTDGLRALLPEPPGVDDGPAWDGLAETVGGLNRELGAEGLTFEQVAERCGEVSGFDDAPRWRVLSGVQRRALARLRELGWMDRDEARRRALERIRAGTESGPPELAVGTLVLLGVAELPRIARGLLQARVEERGGVGTDVGVLVHAPGPHAAGFDALGCMIPERWAGQSLPVPDDAIRVVDRPGDQADAVLEELEDLGGTYSAEEITLGVPDPDLEPFLVDRLSDAGVSARVAAGRPADRSAVFRLIEAVAAWLRSGTFEDLAALLRHPAIEDRVVRDDAALAARLPALLDRFQSVHLPSVLPEGRLPDGGERPKDHFARRVASVRDIVERALQPLRPGSPGGGPARPLSEWPAGLRSVLIDLLGRRPLDRAVPGDRETLHVSRSLERLLESLEALPEALDRSVPATEFLRFVLGRLRETAVPPPADRAAIELLGWLELHLDDAPVLILSGVNEPHLPEAVTADPFLPNRLRSRLGIADDDRRWARDLYRMRAVLESGTHVRLIAGRRGADGSPVRLSRLLVADEPEVIARRIRGALGSDGTPRERSTDGGEVPQVEIPESASPIRLPPEPELVHGSALERLPVTAFGQFLRDPYAFGLERFRGLRALGDEARELDPMGFGSLAHDALQHWGKVPDVDQMDGEELRRAIDRALDLEASGRFGERPLPAVRIQVEQLRSRLRVVAEVQAERNRAGWRIRAIEAMPDDPGVAFPVDDRPFWLRGRIDRIDEHPGEGRWQLLDYKTSSRARSPDEAHRKGRRGQREWVDLQLPLYRRLVAGLSLDIGGAVELGYFSLPSDLERTGIQIAEWDEEELEEAEELAREVVRRIRAEGVRWDPEGSRIREDDPLGPVVGVGTLRPGGSP